MNSKQVIPILVALVLLGGIGIFVLTRGRSQTKMAESPSPTEATMIEKSTEPAMSPSPAEAMTEKSASGSGSPAATGAVKTFTVTGSSFKFAPATLSVNKGDTVKVTFKSSGGVHDFTIDEFNLATKQLPPGQEETVTFVASKAGTFKYYCSVGNHRAQGMEGTLTVK